jgi:hypothetical protein
MRWLGRIEALSGRLREVEMDRDDTRTDTDVGLIISVISTETREPRAKGE